MRRLSAPLCVGKAHGQDNPPGPLENVEGRERYPINVRHNRDFRENIRDLEQVLVATPSAAQIPTGEVATISLSRRPSMIRDEDA